jgi:hypothetical protein
MFSTCGASCAIIHAAVRRTKEENVNRFQEQSLDSQKVTSQELTLVVIHEVPPTK